MSLSPISVPGVRGAFHKYSGNQVIRSQCFTVLTASSSHWLFPVPILPPSLPPPPDGSNNWVPFLSSALIIYIQWGQVSLLSIKMPLLRSTGHLPFLSLTLSAGRGELLPSVWGYTLLCCSACIPMRPGWAPAQDGAWPHVTRT